MSTSERGPEALLPLWAATMPDVDMVPAVMKTATMESPIATS